MNSKSKGSAAKEVKVTAKDQAQEPSKLKEIGGSHSNDLNNCIANDTVNALWLTNSDDKARDRQFGAAIAGLVGIAPEDELEGMMAAQLIAAHSAAMECYRRAMIGEQSFEGRRENLNQANKLSRTFAVLLEALNRHRGKGQQKVTVEHVHVHSGGQAVVGLVETPGGGDQSKSKDQPHAKQIAHAPQLPMWGANETRQPVPITSDAERPMPDARRTFSGRSEGK
jgi:hypothetical protein